jgi:hypothetical protein
MASIWQHKFAVSTRLVLGALALGGCVASSPTESPDSGADASDAAVADATAATDAGADAPLDGSVVATIDATELDASTDVSKSDANIDAGSEDSEIGTSSDAGVDASSSDATIDVSSSDAAIDADNADASNDAALGADSSPGTLGAACDFTAYPNIGCFEPPPGSPNRFVCGPDMHCWVAAGGACPSSDFCVQGTSCVPSCVPNVDVCATLQTGSTTTCTRPGSVLTTLVECATGYVCEGTALGAWESTTPNGFGACGGQQSVCVAQIIPQGQSCVPFPNYTAPVTTCAPGLSCLLSTTNSFVCQ